MILVTKAAEIEFALWEEFMADTKEAKWWEKHGEFQLTLAFLIIGAGLLVGAIMIGAMWMFHIGRIVPEIKLPIVVIFGVVILLIVIGLLTFSFAQLKLASPEQALGLPDGSVRAIIALMLLVLFTIVAIFLYNSVAASGALQSIQNVTAAQLEIMRKQVIVVLTLADAGKETAGPFTVYFRNANPAGEDIARQLITLLGTLVTAVASFYFGATSVASAHDAVTKAAGGQSAPTVTGLTPSTAKRGDAPQIKIAGSNLSNIKTITFARGGTTLGTVIGNASDTEITVSIKADSDPGKYDLVLSDGTKEVARKAQAFEIT
jgi:hypothetical protein